MDHDIRIEKLDRKNKKVVFGAVGDHLLYKPSGNLAKYDPLIESKLEDALAKDLTIRAHFNNFNEEDEITKIHKAWKEVKI